MRSYEQDFAGWAEDTALAISEGRWDAIDREALSDEVLGLSKSDRRAIVSILEVLTTHLLKCRYQPEKKTRSWENTIAIQRLHLTERFEESPSLRAQSYDLLATAYRAARLEAASETGLDSAEFPDLCPWSFAEVIGDPE